LPFLFPAVSFAALNGVKDLLTQFQGILKLVVPIIFGLAMIYFFWGIAQFILHDAGDSKTRDEGKKKILWGIIAIFVMFSIWGILNWVGGLIGIPVGNGFSSSRCYDINQESIPCH